MAFRTPFSKGLIFAAAWYFLPAWLFIPVAAYLYFVPFFQSSKFLAVFIGIMGIYVFTPDPIGYAVIGGILFGWLIAIRELLFIDRRSAYEVLIFAILFFHLRIFYHAHTIIGITPFFAAFILAVLIAWMAKGFLDFFRDTDVNGRGPLSVAIGVGLLCFFSWQILMISFVLPLDFVYQSLLAFLCIVGMLDFLSTYLFGGATREKIFFTATVVFCGLVILLTSAPLGL